MNYLFTLLIYALYNRKHNLSHNDKSFLMLLAIICKNNLYNPPPSTSYNNKKRKHNNKTNKNSYSINNSNIRSNINKNINNLTKNKPNHVVKKNNTNYIVSNIDTNSNNSTLDELINSLEGILENLEDFDYIEDIEFEEIKDSPNDNICDGDKYISNDSLTTLEDHSIINHLPNNIKLDSSQDISKIDINDSFYINKDNSGNLSDYITNIEPYNCKNITNNSLDEVILDHTLDNVNMNITNEYSYLNNLLDIHADNSNYLDDTIINSNYYEYFDITNDFLDNIILDYPLDDININFSNLTERSMDINKLDYTLDNDKNHDHDLNDNASDKYNIDKYFDNRINHNLNIDTSICNIKFDICHLNKYTKIILFDFNTFINDDTIDTQYIINVYMSRMKCNITDFFKGSIYFPYNISSILDIKNKLTIDEDSFFLDHIKDYTFTLFLDGNLEIDIDYLIPIENKLPMRCKKNNCIINVPFQISNLAYLDSDVKINKLNFKNLKLNLEKVSFTTSTNLKESKVIDNELFLYNECELIVNINYSLDILEKELLNLIE